jgi:hypothetical protein
MRGLPLLFLLAPLVYAEVEFNRDIRPILSDKCFGCHGPDAKNKNIPLRLDQEDAAKADLGGRRAIIAGNAAGSEVMKRITTDRKGMRMPPVSTGHTLTEKEVAVIRQWIDEGAKWQKHWSFLPPARAALPVVKNTAWPKTEIDGFLLARLEKEGLQPSPPAAKETLLRRVTLDLTGLPPTPADIDAFLADNSAKAYEKAVDRLLASPAYGERMAARWLDAARYADTNGYQFDGERVMWRWRDYVINSFNQNKPFHQFILEQLAGDMLPNATLQQKIATGFNRNHRANTEDGIIPEEYAVEYVVDRVETTTAVFLGLTAGCARCHNHKYDPLTQKEFYQLFAYFNNVPELGRAMKYGNSPPMVVAPTAEQQAGLDALNAKIQAQEKQLAALGSATNKAQAAWEKSLAGTYPSYWRPSQMADGSWDLDSFPPHSGKPAVVPGRLNKAIAFDGGTVLTLPPALSRVDITDRFSLGAWVKHACDKPCSILSKMNDSPTGKGFGVHIKDGKLLVTMTSNWADDAIRYESEQPLPAGEWHHVALTYTGSRMAEGLLLYVDGKPAKVKVLLDTLYRPFRNAAGKFDPPFRLGAGNGPEWLFKGQLDDVNTWLRVLAPEEVESLAAGSSLQQIAAKPAAQRTAAETRQIRWHFLENHAPENVRQHWAKLQALRAEREHRERTFPTSMIMAESAVPKETHLLQRGQYDKPGETVQPGVPALLPPLPAGAPNNRLGFAQWVIDPGNPLTARVTVNRFWQMLFGTGLVKTVEDFGTQGEPPSHPELLDWLATEFLRTGWDTKALLKTIVMSAAYQQSSKATPELLQRDPENRLLARGPRIRMSAETVRDSALHAAGLLRAKIGGPSVKPYQPAGLWKEIVMQDMDYVQSTGDDLYRRGLYTFWKRTVAPPMMATFDSALRETCTVRENRTNTPLQALNLMNDVTFVEAARFAGQRMLKEGGPDAASRLRYGFRLITSRNPTNEEAGVLESNLRYHLDYFASKPERVEAYLKQGDSKPDPKLNPRELAAYASVASLILNLDEAITKE